MRHLRQKSKTFKTPLRPWEKERIDGELKVVGENGLRCKRELWRVHYTLTKIRKAARQLMTLDAKDPKRVFEGHALVRRLTRLGLLKEGEQSLDHILGLSAQDLLDRRLQTVIFKKVGLAKSIHHARVTIKQRHIAIGGQLVTIPSYMVRLNSEKHITYHRDSPFSPTGRPGRLARKKNKSKSNKAGAAAEDDM